MSAQPVGTALFLQLNSSYSTLSRVLRHVLCSVLMLACVTPAQAQPCGGQWLPGEGIPGMNEAVYATTMWDPDGAGPQPAVLVAGGNFTTAGGVGANHIARWDGTAWSAFDTGVSNEVRALAMLPSGDLVAGGNFITAGPNVSAYVARWTYTNIPWVAVQPTAQTVAAGTTLDLTATPANGYSNVAVQWRRNGVPVVDGPSGASPGGGTVAGASGPLPSPTIGTPATLTITDAQASDAGSYSAVFSNDCGSATTTVATVAFTCAVDFNADGFLNQEDLGGYLTAFLDESLPPGPSGTNSAPCPGEPAPYDTLGYAADFNRDCSFNQEDLGGFITEYFAESENPTNCIPG